MARGLPWSSGRLLKKGRAEGQSPLVGVPMPHRDTISSPFLTRKGEGGDGLKGFA